MATNTVDQDLDKILQERFGITTNEMRDQIKPLFLFMYDRKISSISIDRTGTQCTLKIDGTQIN